MKKLLSLSISFVMAVSLFCIPVSADSMQPDALNAENTLNEQVSDEKLSAADDTSISSTEIKEDAEAEPETDISVSEDDAEVAADEKTADNDSAKEENTSDEEDFVIEDDTIEVIDESNQSENGSYDINVYDYAGENADQPAILTEDSAQASNASSTSYDVNVEVSKLYEDAYKMIAMVNSLRSSLGYGTLTVDNELTEAAMQRAAEISVDFSHTRPDGTSCFTISGKASGENIAAGNSTAEATYNQWYNSSGHYANMINSSYKSIGIGCVYENGQYFWVQLFSWEKGSGSCCTTNQYEVPVKVTVAEKDASFIFANSGDFKYDDNGFPYYTGTLSKDDEGIHLDAGTKFYLGVSRTNPGWTYHTCLFSNDSFTWSNSNKKVVSIESAGDVYVISALRSGTATITATASSGQSISIKINVNPGPTSAYISGSKSTRTVTVVDADSSLTSMKVGVWSSTNGIDDLTWYQMKKKSDGTWTAKIKNINLFDSGTVYVHAYSNNTFIAGTSYTASASDIAKIKPTVSGSGKTRTVTMPSDYADYKELTVRIYSKANSWDDLSYYTMTKQSDGSFTAVVDNTKLLDYGTVRVRVFSGSKYISGTSYKVKKSEITMDKPKISGSGTTRTLTLSSDYSIYSTMKAAVWSNENGQDDLIWYKMKKQSDGSFKATIKTRNIYSSGKVYVHLYSGSTFISGTSFTVKASELTKKSITVAGTGKTRTVTITGAAGLKNLKAAIWSKTNGQDDLAWWPMTKNSDGTWTLKYKTANLKNKGTVYVHVYADSGFVNGGSFKVK